MSLLDHLQTWKDGKSKIFAAERFVVSITPTLGMRRRPDTLRSMEMASSAGQLFGKMAHLSSRHWTNNLSKQLCRLLVSSPPPQSWETA